MSGKKSLFNALANQEAAATWTLERSRSCQNLLGFNIRTILVLLRQLRSALREIISSTSQDDLCATSTQNPADLFGPLQKLLTFVRIYTAWMYVVRGDLAQYHEYLEPHIAEVYQLLADTLNLLLVFVEANQNIASSQYLLSEDVECVGLRPLTDRKLPLFLSRKKLKHSQSLRLILAAVCKTRPLCCSQRHYIRIRTINIIKL